MIKSIPSVIKAILLVLPLFLESCKVDLPKNSRAILKIEKSKCFGECPVFDAVLKNNCWIEFYPKEHTKIKKPSYSKINANEFKNLLKFINSISVDSLKTVYDNEFLMDIPSTYVTFYNGKHEKKIKVRANAPEKIRVLLSKIDEIVKSSDWEEFSE